jgi:DNA replication protein DnaC
MNLQIENRDCLDCGAQFRSRWMLEFPAFKPLRCDECCDLWRPAPDRPRIASQDGLPEAQEPELTRKVGVPARYVDSTFEQFETSTPSKAKALGAAKQWISNRLKRVREATTFVLCGPPGTGKTHLASCMAKTLYEAKIKVKMLKFSTMSRRLTEAAQKGEGQEELCVDYYSKIPVLILDEVRAGAFSKTMEGKMWDIFDNRWDLNLPTVLTTNLPPNGLHSVFPAPTLSRMSRNRVIATCDGNDFRPNDTDSQRLV